MSFNAFWKFLDFMDFIAKNTNDNSLKHLIAESCNFPTDLLLEETKFAVLDKIEYVFCEK